MQRHAFLQDLSREHHTALRLALDARRAAASGDPARIRGQAEVCRRCYADEIDAHFRIEESELLPRLLADGDAARTALVERTQREHAELRTLVAQLAQADAAILARFADLLAAHVRFEERELFEALQTGLS